MAIKTSAHQFFTCVVFVGVVCFAGVACSNQSSLMSLPNLPALRRTMESMRSEYGTDWVQADAYFERLAALESQIGEWDAFCRKRADGDTVAQEIAAELGRLQRDVLLKGPAFDSTRIVMVRRHEKRLGLPQNWQGNSSLPRNGYDNEIVELTLQPDNEETPYLLRTIYRPARDVFVGDLCLHWESNRLLFSSLNPEGRWHVYEIGVDGTGL
ncbi:MAG TPA: hypothetical protein PLL36_10540, partial [Candidatus Hydrogenedentes bacterium]|nr:hypothetical protein [Candidatus Hydrogenedentota bacterium]